MRVTVVIPTYRRPELLQRCLVALNAQEFNPEEYEIIVADDAASEVTKHQVSAFAALSRPEVIDVPVTGAHGPAAARNAGWRRARGRVVAFTDDDCVPEPHWLSAGVAAFDRDPELVAAPGSVVVPLPKKPTDYERDTAGLEGAEFVTANCFCLREALAAVGGFDERFSAAWREDSDLHFAFLERGQKVARVPEAFVVHPVRPAGWGTCLRQQWKSLFEALLYKKHPTLYRQRIRSWPPWDYYAIICSLVLSVVAFAIGHWVLAGILAGIWATLTARFCARRLQGTSHAPMHVAEMVVTSAVIPWLSVFWRIYGAVKFGVFFL
jgi:GT2 family glycosyltransferase